MKMKREYVILIGIIVVLLIYLIFSSGRNKIEYRIPRLKSIASGEIGKIEIYKSGEVTTLQGKEDEWKILPQEYPADSVKVNDMLEVIENLTLTELAAEQQDYQRYELDEENKILVKAYKSDELLREFEIGKTSSTYRHTFVKLPDDNRVFYARESFRSDFDTETKNLRDKVVMKFDSQEITEIKAAGENGDYNFTKSMVPVEKTPEETQEKEETEAEAEKEKAQEPQMEEVWKTPEEQKGIKSEISSLLSSLADLRCDEYLEDKTPESITEPIFTIQLKGNKDYSVKIFAKQDAEDGKYPAVSSENAYVFLLSTYTAERIMKKPEDLIEKTEEEIEED